MSASKGNGAAQPLRLVANTDGASRGNPGPAGLGAVLADQQGQVIKESARYLGRTTSNVAEYNAIIEALEMALGAGATELEVRMDSELAVRQLTGRYQVRSPGLLPLFLRCKELAARFKRVDFRWVPRERNSHADRLANQAVDQGLKRPVPRPSAC